MLIMLPLLTVQNLGAFILNWHLFSSSPLGNCKNAKKKNTTFLTRNPYRLWSFQKGAQNVKNWFRFRKHRILHNNIKPSCFAQFPWSSNLNLSISLELRNDSHKNCGALNWDFFVKKKHGAQNSKCAASLVFKRSFAKNIVFYVICV